MQQNNEVTLEAGDKIQKVKNNGIGNGKKNSRVHRSVAA
jgi:hypothetical protein